MSDFIGKILGNLPPGTVGQFQSLLGQILSGGQGGPAGSGLAGLIGMLEKAGLADQVRSWIGRGENMPVSSEQISGAFGNEKLQAWAKQLGVSQEELSSTLAKTLPHTVDHATPDGVVPPHAAQPDWDVSAVLGRLFGR